MGWLGVDVANGVSDAGIADEILVATPASADILFPGSMADCVDVVP